MNSKTESVQLSLGYTGGTDEPSKGIFRNQPVEPEFMNELVMAVRSDASRSATGVVRRATVRRPAVAGTKRALESLGTYLIALARLQTEDPEPYGSFDDVKYADGGTVRTDSAPDQRQQRRLINRLTEDDWVVALRQEPGRETS